MKMSGISCVLVQPSEELYFPATTCIVLDIGTTALCWLLAPQYCAGYRYLCRAILKGIGLCNGLPKQAVDGIALPHSHWANDQHRDSEWERLQWVGLFALSCLCDCPFKQCLTPDNTTAMVQG